uniref:Cysteine-rich receptor-like protein kinase 10 isoform X3 n=1 Tax=Elaeis guineensis var. tenera TaxID=51953 RepID=A0A6J0PDX7_ELAGV|nr:cysteine-rich receptor-like protein kinase 10 isoform X3 [Elaeis guineensis]
MVSFRHVSFPLFLCLLFHIFLSPPTAGQPFQNCGTTGSYTVNSTYESNLNLLLPSLASNTSLSGGFLNATVGQIPNKIYGLAMCRGDTNASVCRSCLSDAIQDAPRLCPYDKGATIFYNDCLLRYSNQRFFSTVDTSQSWIEWDLNNVTDRSRFDKLVDELMSAITDWAVYNSTRLFATGEMMNSTKTPFPEIYGLVQCTQDLSRSQCQQCLQSILEPRPTQLEGRQEGAVLAASCNFRYGTSKFFDGPSTVRLEQPQENAAVPAPVVPPIINPPKEQGHEKNAARTRIIIFSLVIVTLMLACFVCICLRRRKAMKKRHREEINNITRKSSLLFDLPTIKEATNNFSSANKVGEGGFGTVYKGTLSDGEEIAVKRLSKISGQGLEQLRNEVAFIAQLHHKNLVRLLGYCLEEQEQLLVYEYIQNKSLDTFIFDAAKSEQLNWEQRHNIIRGIARGLLYLHQDSRVRIVHRDLKASNILLDASMNPKISDFGLARLFGGDHTQSKTTRVVGTFFGVLALEIVSGRRNNSFYDPGNVMNLLSYAWQCWTNGTVLKLVDPSMGEHYSSHEIVKCINIGLLCVQENPSDRPNMLSVVLMLNRYKMKLQTPSAPAFLYANAMTESYGFVEDAGPYRGKHEQSTSTSTLFSTNEVSITELDPR